MTVEELINKLKEFPESAIVAYKHNKYGRIDVTAVNCQDEVLLSGNHITIVTLEGKFEEN